MCLRLFCRLYNFIFLCEFQLFGFFRRLYRRLFLFFAVILSNKRGQFRFQCFIAHRYKLLKTLRKTENYPKRIWKKNTAKTMPPFAMKFFSLFSLFICIHYVNIYHSRNTFTSETFIMRYSEKLFGDQIFSYTMFTII